MYSEFNKHFVVFIYSKSQIPHGIAYSFSDGLYITTSLYPQNE